MKSRALRFGTLFALLGLLLAGCSTDLPESLSTTAAADTDSNAVYWWWGDPAGSSKIIRTDNGISGNVASSLANAEHDGRGLAVTLWIVVFNDRSECAAYPDPCTDLDLFNPDVMADILYGSGGVVGASEGVRLGYHRNSGDNSGSIAHVFGLPTDNGESWGLIDPRGAEIHYVVRTHGPKIASQMPDQIHSFEGGCVTDHPVPGGAGDLHFGLGDCQDVQFAINSP